MILPNRDTLKKRLAESMTDPDFTRLADNRTNQNGSHLPIEMSIHSAGQPIILGLSLINGGDKIDFDINVDKQNYSGVVILDEEDITAQVDLRKINGHQVCAQNKKGKQILGYKNGKFNPLSKEAIDIPNYWVPTVINQVTQDWESFIPKEGLEKKITIEPETIGKSHDKRKSPDRHFRQSFTRTNQNGDSHVVTGHYVNTDWKTYTTSEVIDTVKRNAEEMLPRYFNGTLIKEIVKAKHPYCDVKGIYDLYHD